MNSFALGYASKRIADEGDTFINNLPLEQWKNEVVGEVALAMDFTPKTWAMLRRRKAGCESSYWSRVTPRASHLAKEEAEEAVRSLLNAKRTVVAATCAFSAYHAGKRLDWHLIADVVDAASLDSGKAESDLPLNQHFVWELAELMKYLQEDPAANKDRLIQLEYRFLPAGPYSYFSPKTLQEELTQSPTFFAELIEAEFISKAESQNKNRVPDPTKAPLAQAAHRLRESWAKVPGTKADGSIDISLLKSWVEDARKLCTASDRIEICDVMMGDQLSYAPADPDGLWPWCGGS